MKSLCLAVQILFLLIFVKFYLMIKDLRDLINLIKNHNRKFYFNDSLQKNINYLKKLSTLIPGYTCLIGSSALMIISKDKNSLNMVIGISQDVVFKSHAWVTEEDVIVFGNIKDISNYKPIICLN